MNKKIIGVLGSLLVVVMLALPMSAAYATKPTQVSGKWRPTGSEPIADPKNAGANVFTYLSVTGEYFEGPIIGVFVHTFYQVIHFGEPEQLPPATFNWRIERTFTGTVNGEEGTLLIRLNAKGAIPGAPGVLKGTWTNLAGAQFSYEGKIHFDP